MNLGKENETIEFKKTISELKEGVISLSSMLNKSGEATLYFGVKNNGDVVGLDIGNTTTTKVVNEIKYHLKPFVSPKIITEKYDTGSVLKVEMIATDTPYSAYGRYYKRSDDQDLEMTQDELEYCFNNKNITYSKWEKTLTQFDANEVDEDLLIKYIDKANELNRLNYRYESVEDAMTRLGLMENGKLNNAGYFLFSKLKPILVKFAVFATDERITFIDNRHFQGNIFECIEEAYKYILSSINFNAVIIGTERVEKPEIPLEAIREVVVNSFAHMRYGGDDFNEITISPHYVRIYNPGSIALNKDPKEFADGLIGSKLRNPLIALTLYKNKTIEAFGTGFRRVFDVCDSNNVEYSYSSEGLGFVFVFKRNNTALLHQNDRKNDGINERISEKFKGAEKEVFDYLVKNKTVEKVSSIASEINRSPITVQRVMKRLIEAGLARRVGSNKNGHWEIIEKK